MRYFLVDTEAQRQALIDEVEVGEWAVPLGQAGEYRFRVLLAGTPEDEAKAFAFLDSNEPRWQDETFAGTELIDLRGTQSLNLNR
jgi:hypothetical protein